MGFQTQVRVQPAPAVEGDFADTNPRYTVDAGPGGLVAGPAGLTVARFAWWAPPLDPNSAPTFANSFGAGVPTGFVHREQQALITAYLAESSMIIPAGFAVTLFSAGGFWMKNNGTTTAVIGQKVYADLGTGRASAAATASPTTGASATGSIAAGTSSFTGAIAGDVMTVTGAVTGTIYPGTVLSGSGVATGTSVLSQIGGTAGGAGIYYVSIGNQTVAATTISGTYGTFTAASALTGTFGLGNVLSGSGVTAGTTITAFGTGTGGLGTYIVNLTQTAGSTTISAASNVETSWYVRSGALVGEIFKASNLPPFAY